MSDEPQISGIPISKFGTHDALVAEVERLREVGGKLADAIRGLDSYAALGGAPMERTERADRALVEWAALG